MIARHLSAPQPIDCDLMFGGKLFAFHRDGESFFVTEVSNMERSVYFSLPGDAQDEVPSILSPLCLGAGEARSGPHGARAVRRPQRGRVAHRAASPMIVNWSG